MQLAIGEYKWRDRILLLVGWGTIFFTAVSNWALAGLPIEITERTGQSSWQTIEPYIHTILPFIVFFVPILIWVILFIVPSFSLSETLDTFQQEEVFWGLVFTFNLGLLSLISQRFRESLLIEFLLISLVVTILLWLFYRRGSVDITKMILCATLWTLIIIFRQTFLFLQGKVDFFTASWYTKVYVLFMVITLIGSVFLPIVFLFDLRRKIRSKAQEILERIPVGIWAVIFILASLWTFAFFWTMENEIIGVMAMRLGYIAITFSVGGIFLWVFSGDSRTDTKAVLPMGKTWYVILLSLFLVVYIILAFRIGENNLENINPDGLSYLNIAREYAKGNAIIRGYWAPLLSWLIAPWISLGINPHVSYMYLVGLSGFFWILISVFGAKRVGVRRAGRLVIAVGLIIVILSGGFSLTTPDLLGSLFIMIYFYWVLHPDYEDHPIRYGMLAGVAAALAYYSKYYNLLFVLAHLTLTLVLRFLHKRQIRPIVIDTSISLLILGVSIAPWIISLHNRYGEFTISTSGAIVHAVVGPESKKHVCWQDQLCDQPEDVLFPGEDPQPQYYASYGWSFIDSLDHFRYQIRALKNNMWEWASSTALDFGPLIPLGLLAVGFATLIFWKDINRRLCYSWTFLTILLYVSGYMMTYASQSRYYLPIVPLLFLVSYSFIQKVLIEASCKTSERRISVFNLISGIGLIISILSLGHIDLIKFHLTKRNDPCLKNGAEVVAPYLEAPIAGTDFRINYIAYYTKTKTIGAVKSDIAAEEIDTELHEFGVKSFLTPSGSDLALQLMDTYHYPALFKSQLCGIEYLVLDVPER